MVSRRQFLRGTFKTANAPRRPPWALAEDRFIAACSGCGDCVTACPTRVIIRVGRFPEIDFGRGECNFCGACATACTDGALLRQNPQTSPWNIKARLAATCLAQRGVECRICGEHCGPAAIRFSPRLGGPPLAEIDVAACTGCGACVAPCPVAAISIA